MKISVSKLWFLYAFLFMLLPLEKIMFSLFLILSFHELCHIIVAYYYQYRCLELMIHPFGLSACIEHIDYMRIKHAFLIVCAGLLSHGLIIIFIMIAYYLKMISLNYRNYLLLLNIGIFLVNLIPIYPLDGGRLVQLLLQYIAPYRIVCKGSYLFSIIISLMLFIYNHSGFMFVFIIQIIIYNIKAYYYFDQTYYHFINYRKANLPRRVKYHRKCLLYRPYHNIILKNGCYIDEVEWLK